MSDKEKLFVYAAVCPKNDRILDVSTRDHVRIGGEDFRIISMVHPDSFTLPHFQTVFLRAGARVVLLNTLTDPSQVFIAGCEFMEDADLDQLMEELRNNIDDIFNGRLC